MTVNNKSHPFTNRLLNVSALVGDDGTDARAEALARPDDADRLLSLPGRHVANLERKPGCGDMWPGPYLAERSTRCNRAG